MPDPASGGKHQNSAPKLCPIMMAALLMSGGLTWFGDVATVLRVKREA
jgi:hypothetical protein